MSLIESKVKQIVHVGAFLRVLRVLGVTDLFQEIFHEFYMSVNLPLK